MASKLTKFNNPHTAGIYSDMTVDGPVIGTLVVVVDRAKNLPNRRSMGKQDPYCAARLGKEAKKTETDRRGGQTPRWDQELRFTVHDSPDYHNLKVSLFNDDKKTELIGETWVTLVDVVVPGGGQSDNWFNLNCRGKYAGEVRLELTYYDTRPKPEVPAAEKRRELDTLDDEARPRSGSATVKRRPLPSNPAGPTYSPATRESRPLPSMSGPRDFKTSPRPQPQQQPREPSYAPVMQTQSLEVSHAEALHQRSAHEDNVQYNGGHDPDAYSQVRSEYASELSASQYSQPASHSLPDLPPMENSRNRFARRTNPIPQEPQRPAVDLPHSWSSPAVSTQLHVETREGFHGVRAHSEVKLPHAYDHSAMHDYPQPGGSYENDPQQQSPSVFENYPAESGYGEHGGAYRQEIYQPELFLDEDLRSLPPPPVLEGDVPPPPPVHRSRGTSVPTQSSPALPMVYPRNITPVEPLDVGNSRNSIVRRPVSRDTFQDRTEFENHVNQSGPPAYEGHLFHDLPQSHAPTSSYREPQSTQSWDIEPHSRQIPSSETFNTQNTTTTSQHAQYQPYRKGVDQGRSPFRSEGYNPIEDRADQASHDVDVYSNHRRQPTAEYTNGTTSSYSGHSPIVNSSTTHQTPSRPYSMASRSYESPVDYRTPARRYPLAQASPAAVNSPLHSSPPVPFDSAPLIKPRPISPGQLASTVENHDSRQSRHSHRGSLPRRKSVSPRPPYPSENRSSVPFDPDSFNQFNPNAPGTQSGASLTAGGNGTQSDGYPSSRRESSAANESGKIVDFHGNGIDPSDRLPEASWAPEPEKKGPVKVYVRDRERLTGARALRSSPGGSRGSPSEVGRIARLSTSANASPLSGGAISNSPKNSPSESPTAASARNRLQKRAGGVGRPQSMAVLPSQNQPYSDIPDPSASSYSSIGYSTGSPGLRNSYAGPAYGAGPAPPPIPAKIPLDPAPFAGTAYPAEGYSPDPDMHALSEEMKRIDIGPTPGSCGKRTIRAKIFGRG